tara:strand:+ start:300 stop:599 length:300 start_codon:yes stop_codon:yes gene_type:complete
MTELKPCPFCGDPMEWRKGGYAAHIDLSTYCPIATQGFVFATPWNTRAEADTLRDEVARLRAALQMSVGQKVFVMRNGFSGPHETDASRVARAALAQKE